MDSQTIVAAIIVLLALGYAGSLTYKKLSAFTTKKSVCGTSCGCSPGAGSNRQK